MRSLPVFVVVIVPNKCPLRCEMERKQIYINRDTVFKMPMYVIDHKHLECLEKCYIIYKMKHLKPKCKVQCSYICHFNAQTVPAWCVADTAVFYIFIGTQCS